MEPITVPGTLDSLSAIGQYVLSAADEAGLERKAAYRLRLAVDEIATNIIIHGYEEANLTGDVVVKGEITNDSLTIILEDCSQPYDPLQHQIPNEDDLLLPLEQRPIGGLGVYLAMNGVDRFTYERLQNQNRNIFVVYRSPQE